MNTDKLQLVPPRADNSGKKKAAEPQKPKAPRTERQLAASRENGAKSKGPATPEGKYHSSQSALRHGLSATKYTLLANEDPAQYNELTTAFIADFQPATKTELRLVEKLANLDWRMERFALFETCLLGMAVTENYDATDAEFANLDDGITWIVSGWRKSHDLPACLGLLARYMGSLQHQYNSTVANFYKMEKRRRDRRHDPDLDPDYNPPYKQPDFDTLNKEPDGSVMVEAEEEPVNKEELVTEEKRVTENAAIPINEDGPVNQDTTEQASNNTKEPVKQNEPKNSPLSPAPTNAS